MTPTSTKQELELVHLKKEKLEKENEQLKDLVEELYNMSCLDDMIDDLRSGGDDEMLLCNLSLKSQVMEALHSKSPFPKRELAKKLQPLMTEAVKFTNHNGKLNLSDHYKEEKKQ